MRYLAVLTLLIGLTMTTFAGKSTAQSLSNDAEVRQPNGVTWPLLWEVTKGFTYIDINGSPWTVEAGFLSDLASIPRQIEWLIGERDDPRFIEAALVHDQYIVCRVNSPANVHAVFHDILALKGVSEFRRKVMTAAVMLAVEQWQPADLPTTQCPKSVRDTLILERKREIEESVVSLRSTLLDFNNLEAIERELDGTIAELFLVAEALAENENRRQAALSALDQAKTSVELSAIGRLQGRLDELVEVAADLDLRREEARERFIALEALSESYKTSQREIENVVVREVQELSRLDQALRDVGLDEAPELALSEEQLAQSVMDFISQNSELGRDEFLGALIEYKAQLSEAIELE